MMYFIWYIIIGIIVGFFLWHKICLNQTEEEKKNEDPKILIVLPCLIFFWPIGLVSYIHTLIHDKFINR